MTLSTRIALAAKLGYWQEHLGLVHALEGREVAWSERISPAYRRAYEEGRAILEKGEGL